MSFFFSPGSISHLSECHPNPPLPLAPTSHELLYDFSLFQSRAQLQNQFVDVCLNVSRVTRWIKALKYFPVREIGDFNEMWIRGSLGKIGGKGY